MIVCVANMNPEKVKMLLAKKGFDFSMWKHDKCKPDAYYGFFSFNDLLESKVKTTPIFFNIVSTFAHIEMGHPIYKFDYQDKPNGLVIFREPNMKEVSSVLKKKFSVSMLKDVLFRPANVKTYAGSELGRRWNNFILTLPYCVAETFMVAFIHYVRDNNIKAFNQFVIDNRLVGTGNKAAYTELDEILRCMWKIMHAAAAKTENYMKMKKNFLKKNPALDTSLSRFLFWNKSYKGKVLSSFMDNENNVAFGI